MAWTTLIETGELARLPEGTTAIVDCRFWLDDPGRGAQAYAEAHLPGAVYAHLDHDLAGPPSGTNGRHPLPDPATLADTFSRLGIDRHLQVVAYDQDSGAFASRLWWLLRWQGHAAAAVLNGGWAKWVREERPVQSGEVQRARRTFEPSTRPDLAVGVEQVAALRHRPDVRLVDARAPERFRGEVEPIDRVPGHIPGAVNHPFRSNLNADATFRSGEELRAQFSATIGRYPPDRVVCYCGSGVTACHNLLALEHAGLPGARLYPGSWSEWSSDPGRGVELGDPAAPPPSR